MTNIKTLYEDLAYIDAIKKSLVISKQKYIEITEEAAKVQNKIMSANDELGNLSHQIKKNINGEKPEPWITKDLVERQNECDQLNKEKEELLKRQLLLNEEITLQEKAIANNHLRNNVTLKEILEHQENISQATAEAERINQLIQNQTPLINALVTAEKPLNSLLEQKEDVLADIAAGTSSEKELEEVNQQIELVQANIDQAREKADKAKAAQIGLNRKLEEANQILAGLQGKTQGLSECLLHTLAEEEGKNYFEIASQLQKSFVCLMGLHALMQQQSPKRIGICMNNNELRIPGFKLGSAGQYMSETDTWFFDWDKQFAYGHSEQESMAVELQKLKNVGVTII